MVLFKLRGDILVETDIGYFNETAIGLFCRHTWNSFKTNSNNIRVYIKFQYSNIFLNIGVKFFWPTTNPKPYHSTPPPPSLPNFILRATNRVDRNCYTIFYYFALRLEERVPIEVLKWPYQVFISGHYCTLFGFFFLSKTLHWIIEWEVKSGTCVWGRAKQNASFHLVFLCCVSAFHQRTFLPPTIPSSPSPSPCRTKMRMKTHSVLIYYLWKRINWILITALEFRFR